MLCLSELAFVIGCEMNHVDCMNYWLLPTWINFPISFILLPLEMVAFDQLHIVKSFGAQHAITAFLFIVVGTVWWTAIITLLQKTWHKWLSRAEK
jgi:hypothetical protein